MIMIMIMIEIKFLFKEEAYLTIIVICRKDLDRTQTQIQNNSLQNKKVVSRRVNTILQQALL